MKKSERQAIIASIIRNNSIGTQNELIEMLQAQGVDATQATVSRDIKDMRIIKQNTHGGGYKYFISGSKDNSDDTPGYMTLLLGAVERTDIAMNTVVLKCRTGAAQAAAAALENIEITGVAGTIAGDDTMFMLCYSIEEAEKAKETLDNLLGF